MVSQDQLISSYRAKQSKVPFYSDTEYKKSFEPR